MKYAKIIEKYSKLVYTLAVSQTANPADAEKVYQAVFVQYAKTLPFLPTQSRAAKWFTDTTVHIARQTRRTAAPRDGQASDDGTSASRPSKALEKRTLRTMNAPEMPSTREIYGAKLRTAADNCRAFLTIHRRPVTRGLLTVIALAALAVPVQATLASTLPVGGAATGAIHTIRHRADSKKTAAGCTIELMEAKAANDVLYLTIDEDCSNIAYENLSNGADSGTYYYDSYLTDYTGEVRDKAGHTFRFTFDDKDMIDGQIADDSFFALGAYHWTKRFKVYVPGLTDFCNASNGGAYTCAVNVTPKVCHEETGEELAIVTLGLSSPLLGKPSATKKYALDYRRTVGHLTFDFQTLYIGPEESHIAVELVPQGSLEGANLQDLVLTAVAYAVPAGEDDVAPEKLAPDNLDGKPIFHTPVFLSGVLNDLTDDIDLCELGYYSNIYVRDGHCYILLTYQKSASPDAYDYNGLIDTAENGRFRVFELDYLAGSDVLGEGQYETDKILLTTQLHRDKIANRGYHKVFYQTLPAQEVTVDIQQTYVPEDEFDEEYYLLPQQFEAQTLSFKTTLLSQYRDRICFKEPVINGKAVVRDIVTPLNDAKNDGVRLDNLVFLAEKDGQIIGKYNHFYLIKDDGAPLTGSIYADSADTPAEIPDKLILVCAEYAVYDKKNDKWAGHICYNPDYCDSQGLTRDEIEEDARTEPILTEFLENSFFTAVK